MGASPLPHPHTNNSTQPVTLPTPSQEDEQAGRTPVTLKVKDYWETRSCGTNRTLQEKHSLDYFEEIEEFRYRHEPYIHQFAQFTRWRGKDILEVGTGAGTDFLQFARAGAKCHGVDLTQESIDNVTARLEAYELPPQDIQVCNAQSLPFDDGSFDLVYSWGVIHHADNMEAVLSEIYRVTKPGGRVKIMVYNVNSMHAWYMYFRHGVMRGRPFTTRRKAIFNYQESYATKAYTTTEIRRMLKQYPHSDLRFSKWDQNIRTGARFETIRRVINRCTPDSMRWYMAFEFDKK